MKRLFLTAITLGAIGLLLATSAFAQLTPDLNQPTEKRGQTGMKFLSLSLDARAASMGSAMASDATVNAAGLFYNPASIGYMSSNVSAMVGRADWIVDIKYNYGAVTLRPAEGKFGVFGLSFVSVDYGDFQGTVRSSANASGYEDTGTFSPEALAVGLGYGYAVSDRFSFGANVKYAREKLTDKAPVARATSGGGFKTEEAKTNVMAFDFGILYKTGFRSLNFGMTARNFAKDLVYAEERFELPLHFQLGLSMNLLDFTSMDKNTHSLIAYVDAVRPRDFDEHLQFGAEYTLANVVSLRAGYSAPNEEEGISLGGGLQTKFGQGGLHVDYSYTNFGVFDNVNRFTFSFSF